MLTAVASGVTAISFWVTRAEIMAAEANGFNLLDSTGDSTLRYEEAARVGRALNRYPALFGRANRPPAAMAILINEWSYCFAQTLAQGYEHLAYDVRGWYRLLWEAGIPVDFLEAGELDEPYTGAYKAIIVPFPLSLSEETAGKLARYVGQGGTLISEAAPGRIDEHAYCNRGELSPAMAQLFGVAHGRFQMVREPDFSTRWSPPERSWGEYLDAAMLEGAGALVGLRARANVYIETYIPQGGAEPCLRYGDEVAGVVRRVGQGQAWLLGTYLGHNGTAYRDPETHAFVRTLLAQCGVQPAHRGQLLLQKRVGEGCEAWLLTNPTDHEVTEPVDVGAWAKVEDLFGGSIQRHEGRVELMVPSLDVRVLILRR